MCPLDKGIEELSGPEIELQLPDHTLGKLLRVHLCAFETLHGWRGNPPRPNLGPIDASRQKTTELFKARKIYQHAAEVEKQNIERVHPGHGPILAHKKRRRTTRRK